MSPELRAARRELREALAALSRYDRADKGSRWITHPEEGSRLSALVRAADAAVEAAEHA